MTDTPLTLDNRVLLPAAPPLLKDADSLTLLCKATGDALRLSILRLLRTDSLGVLEMSSILGVRQSALSHHLKILSTAGLVSTRRESNQVFYRRVFLHEDDPLQGLKAAVFEAVDRLRLDPEMAERLQRIKKARDQQSLDFFRRFAGTYRQSQLADAQQYAGSLRELLRSLRLPRPAPVLEVGPGEGDLLPMLAADFPQVIALDKSAEMLEQSRMRAQREKLDNIEFVLGDTQEAVERGMQVPVLVISMVLHHVSSPAEFFQDFARLLDDGGVALVVELREHTQDWVRETCGDLWLGFEPEELCNWARQAGFESGQCLYLGLRNGFQIQIRVFHKPPRAARQEEKAGSS